MAGWGPFDLSGKNAVVTGSAMGIGHAIAARFVEAGASVVVADLDGEAAAMAAKELGRPDRAVPMVVDVPGDSPIPPGQQRHRRSPLRPRRGSRDSARFGTTPRSGRQPS